MICRSVSKPNRMNTLVCNRTRCRLGFYDTLSGQAGSGKISRLTRSAGAVCPPKYIPYDIFQPWYLDLKLNGIGFLIIFTSIYQGWGKIVPCKFWGVNASCILFNKHTVTAPEKIYPASRPANMYILLSFCRTSGRLTKTFIHAHVHVYDAFCAY